MVKSVKVSKAKLRTPTEEHVYLRERLNEAGNFFAWEVHPNRVRAANILIDRLQKKLWKLLESEEYKFYNEYD